MKTYEVIMADATGDSLVQMTAPEIIEAARSGSWTFVDDRLVQTDMLNETVLDDAQFIRLMPGLVGGNEDQNNYDDD